MIHRRPAVRTVPTALGALLLLSACGEGREPEASPESGPGGYNMVPPVEAEAMPGSGDALTAGTWQATGAGDTAALRFVAAQTGAPLFQMSCDDRGGIVLDRLGQESVGDIEMMDVNVGDQVSRLALNEIEADQAVLRAVVPFNDDLLVPLARPQGRLSVEAGDTPRLRLPLNPQTAALAAACQQPDGGSAGEAANAAGNAAGS